MSTTKMRTKYSTKATTAATITMRVVITTADAVVASFRTRAPTAVNMPTITVANRMATAAATAISCRGSQAVALGLQIKKASTVVAARVESTVKAATKPA